jgi:hypothetical protein
MLWSLPRAALKIFDDVGCCAASERAQGSHLTYAEAMPPDLVAPVSPSAALTLDMEKDLLRDVVLTLASLMTFWRSIFEVCL